ncbi:hypothetical protein [Cupriavidus campinensis]|uniref:Uncharacterized protein n=1 Tax=Cupriavidus campinensis TaxID=151783 RepID=A0AAE9I2D9_9BURK|nr:hypothetical protein [Cupriavidus campinensis]URF05056.1 hypothetical protein M5D45_04250 [Cupriavidus campinensis]
MPIKKNEQLHLELCKGLTHVVKHGDWGVLERALKKATGKVTAAHAAMWVESFTPFKTSVDETNAIKLVKPSRKLDLDKFNMEAARATRYWELKVQATKEEAQSVRESTVSAFRQFLRNPSTEHYDELQRCLIDYKHASAKTLPSKSVYVHVVQGGAPGLGKRA